MKVNIGPYPDKSDEKPQVSVVIDNYDIWSLDYTLALIIAPALRFFKENNHGGPAVHNDDVPVELHSPDDRAPWTTDDNWKARYDYILDEMIFAFEAISNDCTGRHNKDRISNGLRLFGKYYRSLWD